MREYRNRHKNSKHFVRAGRDKIGGKFTGVGPRSYRDVLRAGVNDNYSIKQRPNREENNADEKAELVVACKESKKDSERPKELAWKMGEQKDGNEVAPLKSWAECKVQIVEVENEWLKSSAVGRPRAGLSPEEI
ncbi:hypothetical protein QQP08_026699 [Theobroma cacao]|nr:hypothetical protein QQP08_026699 [Theobroma cacao]